MCAVGLLYVFLETFKRSVFVVGSEHAFSFLTMYNIIFHRHNDDDSKEL
jgi:hypothetical protein